MKKYYNEITALVDARIGKAHIPVSEILKFSEGSIIEFDSMAGEPVLIYANNTLIGKGEVVVIDENFGVRVTEIIDKVMI